MLTDSPGKVLSFVKLKRESLDPKKEQYQQCGFKKPEAVQKIKVEGE